MANEFVEGTFMANKFTQSIVLAAMAAGACFATGAASAQACINGMYGGTNIGPDASCPTTQESEIFLTETHSSTTVPGNIGSQTGLPAVQFTSDAALTSGSGNSTINPASTGNNASFPNLAFTIPSHTFTDFSFELQLVNATALNLTVEALSGSTVAGTVTYAPNSLVHDQPIDFTISDPAGLTEIEMASTSGLKSVKSFDVSGVSTPEPSTWTMMVLGLGGIGLAAIRRAGRPRLSGAMA
jgi:hypothetical protein